MTDQPTTPTPRFFEAVPVERELPEKRSKYFCIDPNAFIPNSLHVYGFELTTKRWMNDDGDTFHPSHWLRPLELADEVGQNENLI